MRSQSSIRGHAFAEFVLMFPIFVLMLLGLGDLLLLSLSRLSLQRECFQAAKYFAAEGQLPPLSGGMVSVSHQVLPSGASSQSSRGGSLRAARTFELVQIELEKQIPFHFPLLRIVFRSKSHPVKARSTVLRVIHEK